MYCPECNHPLLGNPDTCPNCGHILHQPEIPEDKADQKPASEPHSPQYTETQTGTPPAPKTDKKALWAAIFVCTPLLGFILLGISLAFGSIPTAQTIVRLLASLLMLLSFVLVPAALVLGIISHRSINRSKGTLTGKGLAIVAWVFSTVMIIGSIAVISIVVIFNLDTIMEIGLDAQKNFATLQIKAGLEKAEADNKEAGKQNSFGSFFPESLDNADLLSKSGPNNPFFTEVISDGWKLPGWEKGSEPNVYLMTQDSTVYIYDPENGTFAEKQK